MKCFKSENRYEIIMLIKILRARAIHLSAYKSKLKRKSMEKQLSHQHISKNEIYN